MASKTLSMKLTEAELDMEIYKVAMKEHEVDPQDISFNDMTDVLEFQNEL